MSYTDANRQRYSTDWQQASYLEAEWSDYLLGHEPQLPGSANPFRERSGPTFYKEIAECIEGWLERREPARCCDVGGSTGRTLYELAARVDSLAEFVLAEPSSGLAGWAKKLLCTPDEVNWVPIVQDWQRASWAKAQGRPEDHFTGSRRLFVYEADSESVPRPPGYFDLVTCLNVADRVPNPRALVTSLRRLLSENGLLVVSSPLQFDERFTPDLERWVTDLWDLFDEGSWIRVGDTNVVYDIRRHRREWLRYCSQVIAVEKQTGRG